MEQFPHAVHQVGAARSAVKRSEVNKFRGASTGFVSWGSIYDHMIPACASDDVTTSALEAQVAFGCVTITIRS